MPLSDEISKLVNHYHTTMNLLGHGMWNAIRKPFARWDVAIENYVDPVGTLSGSVITSREC